MAFRLSSLILPYTRAELPGWGRLMARCRALGNRSDPYWVGIPPIVVRGKHHGYLMRLDRSDWAQRMTYFLGRYYELGVLTVLDSMLKPGDRFVDIGANIGMIALHARHLVGATGQVDCYEPLPLCANAIREHVRLNRLANVHVHQLGLSDENTKLEIKTTSEHSGTATFGNVTQSDVVGTFVVDVRTGDELIDRADFIKIDVEGFELRVLKGLKRVIEESEPIIVTELNEALLSGAGATAADIADFLQQRGYRPYGINTKRKGLRHHIALQPLERETLAGSSNDVLWIPRRKQDQVSDKYGK
jgi:FkbM family methyltransferase